MYKIETKESKKEKITLFTITITIVSYYAKYLDLNTLSLF